jgi:hypothetical protein
LAARTVNHIVTTSVLSGIILISTAYGNYAAVQPDQSQGIDMIETNTRTLGVLLAIFVALTMFVQSAQRVNHVAVIHPVVVDKPVVAPAVIEQPVVKKASNELVAIPKEKCASTWVNGGNFVLVTPKTCNDVSIASMTIAVSSKPCDASTKADFQNLTASTYFKGDFGFYVGQGKSVQCLAVQEIVGKYL